MDGTNGNGVELGLLEVPMTALETCTLLTAMIGAVLGIINTWSQFRKDRVKLRVVPKVVYLVNQMGGVLIADRPDPGMLEAMHGKPSRLCVEITNLSAFPVTIHEVGFGRKGALRAVIFHPDLLPQDRRWPPRLEPRESVTAFAGTWSAPLMLDPNVVKHAVAFAATDCGTVAYGSSPIFREYMRQVSQTGESRVDHG
jgi:hypothetical protein